MQRVSLALLRWYGGPPKIQMHGCNWMVSSSERRRSVAMVIASVRVKESRSPYDDCRCCYDDCRGGRGGRVRDRNHDCASDRVDRHGNEGSSGDCCCRDLRCDASCEESLARVGTKSLSSCLSRGVFREESLDKELLALAGF